MNASLESFKPAQRAGDPAGRLKIIGLLRFKRQARKRCVTNPQGVPYNRVEVKSNENTG